MARRIQSMKVTKLALCKRGVNGFGVLYKSRNPDALETGFEVEMLTKGLDEKGLLTCVVYAPDRVDSEKHFASAEAIRDAAHSAMRDGVDLNIEHGGRNLQKSEAHLAESFIVQKGDTRFEGMTDYSGRPVGDLTGAWAVVVQIHDEGLRKAYRSGEWQGISLEGFGRLAKSDDTNGGDPEHSGDTEMTPAEIAALTKSLQESVTAAVVPINDRLTKLEKAEADKAEALKKAEADKKAEKPKKTLAEKLAKASSENGVNLVLAEAEMETLTKSLAEAVEGEEFEQVPVLRTQISAKTKEVVALRKAVNAEIAARANDLKKSVAPLGSADPADGSGSNLDRVTKLVGLKKSNPNETVEDQQFEDALGLLIAKSANASHPGLRGKAAAGVA